MVVKNIKQVAKKTLSESISIPSGVQCAFNGNVLSVSKGAVKLNRIFSEPSVTVRVEGDKLVFQSARSGKKALKMIKSYIAHVNNIFKGLDEVFTYKLETCNVHFPMTLKVEKDRLAINNFLGEKSPRYATILPNVTVDVKGQIITVTSHDKELAGQTAASIEKATKVRNRDRRVFQDGIYIIEKSGVAI
jgi:large subunit ribosomal protein L6